MDSRSAFEPINSEKVNPDNSISMVSPTVVEVTSVDVVRKCWECCSGSIGNTNQASEEDNAKAKELSILLNNNSTLPINSLRDANQHTLLIRCCAKQGNSAAVQVLLSRINIDNAVTIDWNVCDVHGNSPLHHAIMNRNVATAQLLLDTISANSAGSGKVIAYIQKTNNLGCSSLHLAAEHGDIDMLKLLLMFAETVQISSGERIQALDVNCQDSDGFSPLHYACMYSHPIIIHHLVAVENASPLIFNCAGELPSDLTKNALTKKFLMAATQYRLVKTESVSLDKRIKIENTFEESSKALLESVNGVTARPVPGSPTRKAQAFIQNIEWNNTTNFTLPPVSPKRSPTKAAPSTPTRKLTPIKDGPPPLLSPERMKTLHSYDPVKDAPALFEATFKAMTEEARELIQQREISESSFSFSVFNKSPTKSSPSKGFHSSNVTPQKGKEEPRPMLSSEKAFAESIAKFERYGANKVNPPASKIAPLDTGIKKKVPEKLVIDFDSDDEIVFKPYSQVKENIPIVTNSSKLLNNSTMSGSGLSGAALRQQRMSNLMSQPKNRVEKVNTTKSSSNNNNYNNKGRSVSTPVRPRRPKSASGLNISTTINPMNMNGIAKAVEKIKQTVTPRRSASTGNFGLRRSKSIGMYINNPLLAASGAAGAVKPKLNSTTVSSSSGAAKPPLSPTRAYLSSLTPSKSYMMPTTSVAVSAGMIMEKRQPMFNNPLHVVIPRSATNKYHQLMPSPDEVLNTEKVELQVFIGTLNRILDLHTNGLKKMFYRWKHFKVPEIGARKRLTASFNEVASPGSDYDDSHVVRAVIGNQNYTLDKIYSNPPIKKVSPNLHVAISPVAVNASHHGPHHNQLDQFSPVSMSDLSTSTLQDMAHKKKGNNLLMGISRLNSPYATLKSTKQASPSKLKRATSKITKTDVHDTFDVALYSRIEPMIRNNEFILEKVYFHFSSDKSNYKSKQTSIPMFDRCLMSEMDLWSLLMSFGVCPQICSKVQLSHAINVILNTHVPVSQNSTQKATNGRTSAEELTMDSGIISFIHFVKILWQISYLCNTSVVENPPPTVQFAYLLQIMDSSGGRQKIAKLNRSGQTIPPFVYLNILNDVY